MTETKEENLVTAFVKLLSQYPIYNNLEEVVFKEKELSDSIYCIVRELMGCEETKNSAKNIIIEKTETEHVKTMKITMSKSFSIHNQDCDWIQICTFTDPSAISVQCMTSQHSAAMYNVPSLLFSNDKLVLWAQTHPDNEATLICFCPESDWLDFEPHCLQSIIVRRLASYELFALTCFFRMVKRQDLFQVAVESSNEKTEMHALAEYQENETKVIGLHKLVLQNDDLKEGSFRKRIETHANKPKKENKQEKLMTKEQFEEEYRPTLLDLVDQWETLISGLVFAGVPLG